MREFKQMTLKNKKLIKEAKAAGRGCAADISVCITNQMRKPVDCFGCSVTKGGKK